MDDDLLPKRYVRVRAGGRRHLVELSTGEPLFPKRNLMSGFAVDYRGDRYCGPKGDTWTLIIFKPEDIAGELRMSKTYGRLVPIKTED